jgi:ABC-type multidrug transport system ATPase subunit
MPANESALNVIKVSRSFGKIKALEDVSFAVNPQSIFGLLGPNGAGKTTLFSIAANFIRADEGTVEVLGVDAKRISQLKGRLTILPQGAQFQRNVPILEQLVLFRLLDGKNRKEAEAEVKRTLERVGLGDYIHRGVYSLSHGMIGRLGVAQAFLGDPEVILLDEPTSGLDPKNARQIRDLIRELKSRATVVMSSHNLAEVQELCDHVAILDKGRLVMTGSVEEITRAARQLELRLSRSLSQEELQRLTEIEGVSGIRTLGTERYTLSLDLGGMEDKADQITNTLLRMLLGWGITPRSFREGASLEEHFLRVTGNEEEHP